MTKNQNKNKMLEHAGFQISEETEDKIVYYIEDNWEECHVSLSVDSDLENAVYYEPGKTPVKIEGILNVIEQIRIFFNTYKRD